MSKWVKRGGKARRVKADGEVRRSQTIRTYGAGSIMDLVDRSALIGGLDFWRFGTEGSTVIREDRLLESTRPDVVLERAQEVVLSRRAVADDQIAGIGRTFEIRMGRIDEQALALPAVDPADEQHERLIGQ